MPKLHPQLSKVNNNQQATEAFVKMHYPNENFISDSAEFQSKNRYAKGLVIPEGVKVAESRIPRSPDQRSVLRKELRQAEILTKRGNSVYFIPENAGFGIRPKDAIVNGQLFEFRTITGNAKTLEWQFRDAKKKGIDTNVFINVISDLDRDEVRRRIGSVIRNHQEYTGTVIMSFDDGENLFWWDSNSFR